MHAHTAPASTPIEEQENHSASETERLREDLELVSYLISHDLQAPLRIMQNAFDVLRTHSVSDATRDELRFVEQEAARLKSLMQDLLDYIRLETFAVAHSTQDSGELARTAIATLDAEIKAAGATVICDELPQVTGHRNRLIRLFAHLLSNALKFRGKEPPQIHISAQRASGGWEFCVGDNGIGIHEDHQDIIFRLFQRLHPGNSYPGNGAGLALAQKIVESHGGSLRVESGPNRGSRFYFTLPAALL